MNDTNNANMDAVLRRVQKLLAMANDGRGDANEAAAAAQMAEKLMRKYQLDNADVIEAELKAKGTGTMASGDVFANMKRDDPKRPPLKKNPPWGQHLAVAIGRLNDCEVRQAFATDRHGAYSACLRYYGYHADVLVSVWMFDYLVGATIAACKVFNAARVAQRTVDKRASDAFRSGFMTTLTARIYEQAATKKREAEAMSSSRALVVSKRQAIAEVYGDFGYSKSKAKAVHDYNAYSSGMAAAHKVDLNARGIAGASSATPAPVATARRITN